MAVQTSLLPGGSYPEGQALQQQVTKRQRRADFWRSTFLAATLIGMIALTALLYNILNSAFGYVAVQNAVDPQTLALTTAETKLLGLPHLQTSEDDEILAAGVAADANAIGFFGYAYYQRHADQLKALPIEGVTPGAASINAGQYPLARPLYLYTTAQTLVAKPQVAAFLADYLANVNDEIEAVGYFPIKQALLAAQQEALIALAGGTVADAPAGDIHIAGSSTVYPLTDRMATRFVNNGFGGQVQIERVGTKAGIVQFCAGEIDIANASRAMTRSEIESCRKNRIEPVELRIGTDALAVVVSQQNDFLTGLSLEQLRRIFGAATNHWSEIEAAWPAAPIMRFTPGVDSGTLDYFVETTLAGSLADLPKETLLALLEANVSAGLMRRLERDKPFAERTQEEIYSLVMERVVEPKVVASWPLMESITQRGEIERSVAEIPNGTLEWRSWLTPQFLTASQSSTPEQAGIRGAILGSLWVILFTLVIALPVGVGAAIYLEEYATDTWLNRLIATNISNLAGVPSIIYGMLGLAIFVRALEPLTSGKLFGLADPTTANGRTVLSAGLTLALLVLPLIIINAQEAIRAVPRSLREAGYGLGATKWQVIWAHVLPSALPGILTGNILAMSRAIGETAPLVVVGASTFISVDPSGPFSKFTTLPAQIYQWTARPQDEFRHLAAAAIIVLLALLLTLNAVAVLLRNRYSKVRI
jgi:phosphate transport system permease protein